MVLQFLKLVIASFFWSLNRGTLVQISGNTIICPDDVAVFWCSENGVTFLNWEVSTRTGESWPSFINIDKAGTIINGTLNSSLLHLQVIFVNDSFINVSLTITKPVNLNGSLVVCNRDRIIYHIHKSSVAGDSPTALYLSKNIETSNLYIQWTPEEQIYCIQVNEGCYIKTNASYTLPLANTTYYTNISVSSDIMFANSFLIGSCIYNDPHMHRTYVLHLSESWTINQICNNSTIEFDTKCTPNGNWTMSIECQNYSHNGSGITNKAAESQTVLIASCSLIAIITISTTAICIGIIIYMLKKRSRKMKTVKEYVAHVELSANQDEYATLQHKNTSEIHNDEYGTVQDIHKFRIVKYAEVDTQDQKTTVGILFNSKMDYAQVNKLFPEDKTLNLDVLLIQLKPISKDFRVFGSALGISTVVLDRIADSCSTPFDGLVEVCDAWLNQCHKKQMTPTWHIIAKALSLLGQDKMAHDIMQVYRTGKLPIEVDMSSLEIRGELCQPTTPPVTSNKNEDTKTRHKNEHF